MIKVFISQSMVGLTNTVINPKGYKESFTEGYMWRK